MISTGSDSSGWLSKAFDENDTIPQPSTSTCRATEAASVLSTFSFTPLGPLLHFGHQRQPLEAGARQLSHDARHGAVVGLLVRPHENALIEAATSVGDRLQLRDQVVHRHFGVVDEDLACGVDRELQRRLV